MLTSTYSTLAGISSNILGWSWCFSRGEPSDELWIKFGPLLGVNRTLSEEDIQASLHLTELWTNFVKYGDPTPPGLESSNDQVWVPVSTDDKRYLKLGSTISMESRSENYLDRMQFWRNLFPWNLWAHLESFDKCIENCSNVFFVQKVKIGTEYNQN